MRFAVRAPMRPMLTTSWLSPFAGTLWMLAAEVKRVVVRRIELALHHGGAKLRGIAHGADDLGDAAQAVRLLHEDAGTGFSARRLAAHRAGEAFVRCGQPGTGGEPAHVGGARDLARVRLRPLVAGRGEGAGGGGERLERERGDDLGLGDLGPEVADDEAGEAGHRGGAVDERERLLVAERQGWQRDVFGGGAAAIVAQHVALADQGD